MQKREKKDPRGFSERAKLFIVLSASAVLADTIVIAYIWYGRVGEDARWLLTHMPIVAEHLLLTLILGIGGAILYDWGQRKLR